MVAVLMLLLACPGDPAQHRRDCDADQARDQRGVQQGLQRGGKPPLDRQGYLYRFEILRVRQAAIDHNSYGHPKE
jgi:hypothetical protein